MKNRILLVAIGIALGLTPLGAMASSTSPTASSPFVAGGSVTVNSMPQSENPIWTPPLASPSVTSSGLLSAFYTSNMSQANPNSPQPSTSCTAQGKFGGPGTSPGSYVWSGSDNTGWVLQGSDCATSAQPTPSACQYAGSPGSYTWNGSSWVLSGGDCAPAAPVASCPSGYGGSPGSYSWNGSSWVLSGQSCTAPVPTGFIGGGSGTTTTSGSGGSSTSGGSQAAATILWYKPVVTHGLNYHMANNTGKTIPQYSGTDPYPTLYTVLERFGNAIQFNTLTGTVTYGRCFIHSNPCRFYIPSH